MIKFKRSVTLLSASCLALTPVAPVYAANWVYVDTNSLGTEFYYDSDTIQRFGNQVTFWQKDDYSRNKARKERGSKSRYRYDCAMRTRVLLQLTNYYPDGKNKTFTWSTYEQEVEEITPDTVGEAILEAVCQ